MKMENFEIILKSLVKKSVVHDNYQAIYAQISAQLKKNKK